MRLQFSLTQEDLTTAMRLRTRLFRIAILCAVWFGGLMTLLALWDAASYGDAISWTGVLLRGLIMGALFGAFMGVAFNWLLIPLQARRYLRHNPLNFGEIVMTAEDEGIRFENTNMSSSYAWSDLLGYKEAKDGFLISSSRMLGHYVPKSAMRAEEVDALRRLLSSNLKVA